jgi:phosphate butyryltransferase
MIRNLDQMVDKARSEGRKKRVAVAVAHDENSISALHRAVETGMVEAFLTGNRSSIEDACLKSGINPGIFNIIETANETLAASEAVRMVREDEADILMKGLLSTEEFLKPVMNKNSGLMIPDAVLSHVAVIEMPAYHKLLFITDPAVIPFPDIEQKIAMAKYGIEMASRFGITNPRVALVGASEKVSRHFPSSADSANICRMTGHGESLGCVMDGPLDVFLACDKRSVKIKGINTRVDGDADILLFPSLESSNPFYKGLMLFARGEIAGLLRGTRKPVIVISRGESERSKFYCIALACLMV